MYRLLNGKYIRFFNRLFGDREAYIARKVAMK